MRHYKLWLQLQTWLYFKRRNVANVFKRFKTEGFSFEQVSIGVAGLNWDLIIFRGVYNQVFPGSHFARFCHYTESTHFICLLFGSYPVLMFTS